MLRLNRITDYAVVVLTQMVREPEKRVTAPQLSEESNVPAPTVAKVLKALAKEGVLASQRGVKGGYRLAQPAGDISIPGSHSRAGRADQPDSLRRRGRRRLQCRVAVPGARKLGPGEYGASGARSQR